jgi:hypothetical protein
LHTDQYNTVALAYELSDPWKSNISSLSKITVEGATVPNVEERDDPQGCFGFLSRIGSAASADVVLACRSGTLLCNLNGRQEIVDLSLGQIISPVFSLSLIKDMRPGVAR